MTRGPSAEPVAVPPARHRIGVAMVLAAGALLSIAGIVIRQLESAGGWQIHFYRSIGFFVVVFLYLAVRYRTAVLRSFVDAGRPGIIVALCLGFGSACYIFALLLTTVANALFIISAAPFLAALLGWVVLGERVRPLTWAMMAMAIAGVAIMVFDGVRGGRLLGNLVALGTPLSFAIMLVTMRHAGRCDMVPGVCLAGLVGAALGFAMADTLVIPARDLALCLFLGVAQYGAGFVLITLGARHLPAAEVALLSLTEVILAPIWVWVGIGEVPSTLTLVGGAVVLGAVVVQALHGASRAPAPAISAPPPAGARDRPP